MLRLARTARSRGHATLLRDVYVGRGGFHPQAAAFVDAAYRD